MDIKKPWQSKTHWVALLMAILAFIPGFSEFVVDHPTIAVLVQTGLMVFLRWISAGKIGIS